MRMGVCDTVVPIMVPIIGVCIRFHVGTRLWFDRGTTPLVFSYKWMMRTRISQSNNLTMKDQEQGGENSVQLPSIEEIKKLEAQIPECRAFHTFLTTYTDSNGRMDSIMDDDEILELYNGDDGFKCLCDLLLCDPITKGLVNTGPDYKGKGLSRKQRFSIEMDRARVWKGLYD